MKTYTNPDLIPMKTIEDVSHELNRIIIAMADVEGDAIRSKWFDTEGNLHFDELYDYSAMKKRLKEDYKKLYSKLVRMKNEANCERSNL